MSAADRVRHVKPRLAPVGDVDLCYETFGDPDEATMLLIMGMGFQLIHWPEDFCVSSPPRASAWSGSTTATRLLDAAYPDAGTPWRTWPMTPSVFSMPSGSNRRTW